MKATHVVRTAGTGLTTNKMRSTLTVLGVVIGVASVIALLSIGRGTQVAITSNIQSMGTNLLFVGPGAVSQSGVRSAAGSAATLTMDDAAAIADSTAAPAVYAVAPQVQAGAQIVAGNQNTRTQVIGVTPEYSWVRNFPIERGDFVSASQVQRASLVVVLGNSVAQTLFGLQDPVGQPIRINGLQYEVIGVLKSKGGSGFGNSDDQVIAPITTVQRRLSNQRTTSGAKTVQQISIQVAGASQNEAAIQQVTAILQERHRIAPGQPDDFTVQSQQDMVQALQQSTSVFVIFLGAIAGISLLVGGIGIMNIMLVSVTERTREIGIRKSVGARRQDILLQFLVESATLSLLGGGIGILLGWGISRMIGGIRLNNATINTVMSLDILVLAVSVSAAIGLIFGLYPAYRAARLSPIDALRYE
ncbi:MAG: ABC transporter permease [Chloroflexi bacterium]|nr:ABC transporter permease [Chloroflexota bacterium]